MNNFGRLLVALSVSFSLPAAAQTEAEVTSSSSDNGICEEIKSDQCIIDTHNAIVEFATTEMSDMCNAQGLVCTTDIDDLIEKNNLSLHWHACREITRLHEGASSHFNHLSAPDYCLDTVPEFAAAHGKDFDEERYNELRDHLDRLKDIHRQPL